MAATTLTGLQQLHYYNFCNELKRFQKPEALPCATDSVSVEAPFELSFAWSSLYFPRQTSLAVCLASSERTLDCLTHGCAQSEEVLEVECACLSLAR